MPYVDGFVVPVPKANLERYKAMAATAARLWKEYGALEFKECIADDVSTGELTSFPQSVQLKDDEVVIFSWIKFPSRSTRDEINRRVMADPRMAEMMDPATMPFDGKRMIYGGFEIAVDL